MNKGLAVSAVLLLALGVALGATSAAAQSGPKATGGVTFEQNPGGAFAHADKISFNAQPTGAGDATTNFEGKGKVNSRAPDFTSPSVFPIPEFTFNGTVDCYWQSGSTARFSGVIDEGGVNTDPNNGFGGPVGGPGDFFLVGVEDNSEPGWLADPDPDFVRTRVAPKAGHELSNCANPDWRPPVFFRTFAIDGPVLDGNLQVHPANG